jgi:hypothetical protein
MKLSTVQFVYRVIIANTSKNFGIVRPELLFLAESDLPNPSITALYLPKENAVIVNADWVVNASKNEQISTILHEMRHAFQHHAVSGRIRPDLMPASDVLKQWKKEIAHPVQPDPADPTSQNYLNQAIEQDAIRYARENMNSESLFLP